MWLKLKMGVYFLCLLLCDLGPALSAMSNLNWSLKNVITHSGVCDFQVSLASASFSLDTIRSRFADTS